MSTAKRYSVRGSGSTNLASSAASLGTDWPSVQVTLTKPKAEVSKEQNHETYRKWLCNTHFNLNLLSFDFSFEASTFCLLVYWNLTFLLTSLLALYFSIEISTFSLLVYWNLYFLFTFPLKSLLSLYFSMEISTFFALFYWNLYFLFTFLFKFVFSLYLSIKISTFSSLFYRDPYFLSTCLLKSLLSLLLKSLLSLYFSIETSTFSLLSPRCRTQRLTPLAFATPRTQIDSLQCNYARKNFKEKLCSALDGSRARPAPHPCHTRAETTPHTASHTTSFRDLAHSDFLWKHRQSHASFLWKKHIAPRLPRKLAHLMSELFKCELPLD